MGGRRRGHRGCARGRPCPRCRHSLPRRIVRRRRQLCTDGPSSGHRSRPDEPNGRRVPTYRCLSPRIPRPPGTAGCHLAGRSRAVQDHVAASVRQRLSPHVDLPETTRVARVMASGGPGAAGLEPGAGHLRHHGDAGGGLRCHPAVDAAGRRAMAAADDDNLAGRRGNGPECRGIAMVQGGRGRAGRRPRHVAGVAATVEQGDARRRRPCGVVPPALGRASAGRDQPDRLPLFPRHRRGLQRRAGGPGPARAAPGGLDLRQPGHSALHRADAQRLPPHPRTCRGGVAGSHMDSVTAGRRGPGRVSPPVLRCRMRGHRHVPGRDAVLPVHQ